MVSRSIKYLIIITICLAIPQNSFAEETYKEVYEYDFISVEEKRMEDITHNDSLEGSNDLSIPDSRMLSMDINRKGELLVCFMDKILIFNEDFNPVRAYEIYWGKGNRPFVIWNQKTNNIMYIRGNGYEINAEGLVIREYKNVAYSVKEKVTRIEWEGRIYELQNRTHLPQINMNRNKTYSTLVMIDEKGEEVILCNSLKKAYMGQIIEYLLFPAVPIVLIVFIREKCRNIKRKKVKYDNIQNAELYKRIRVKKRPEKLKIKDKKR